MDLAKQYIVQSISAASSNLRLSNQHIEVIAMLKEAILRSNDLHYALIQMKKITELSKIAIKLDEMYHYLEKDKVDFLKLTDKFKEHSFNLIKELSSMLDLVNPYTFRQSIDRLGEPEKKVVEIVVEPEIKNNIELQNSLSSTTSEAVTNHISEVKGSEEAELLKVEKGNEDSDAFNSFESTILKPIKSIDSLLNEININSEVPEAAADFSKLMSMHADLSSQNGFEILAQMHTIISKGLGYLINKSLIPSKEVIESLRACLIVIVAVVKSKEVDVKNYLNRAEVFGKFLQRIKTEEIK